MGNSFNSKAGDEPYIGTDPIYQNHAYDEQAPLVSSEEGGVELEVRAAMYEEQAKVGHTIPGILPGDDQGAGKKFADAKAARDAKATDEATEADTARAELEAKVREKFEPSPAAGESAPADEDAEVVEDEPQGGQGGYVSTGSSWSGNNG